MFFINKLILDPNPHIIFSDSLIDLQIRFPQKHFSEALGLPAPVKTPRWRDPHSSYTQASLSAFREAPSPAPPVAAGFAAGRSGGGALSVDHTLGLPARRQCPGGLLSAGFSRRPLFHRRHHGGDPPGKAAAGQAPGTTGAHGPCLRPGHPNTAVHAGHRHSLGGGPRRLPARVPEHRAQRTGARGCPTWHGGAAAGHPHSPGRREDRLPRGQRERARQVPPGCSHR